MAAPTTEAPIYYSFEARDGVNLVYQDHGAVDSKILVLLHGFTGSSEVWSRNIPALKAKYRVIAPDLRGHGHSGRSLFARDHNVPQLAQDLHDLFRHLGVSYDDFTDEQLQESTHPWHNAIAGSLGCAILWSYQEQFGTRIFDKMIWVDQSPLQNYAVGWGVDYGNRTMNSPEALAQMKAALESNPEEVYRGTINACLAYLWDPVWGRKQFDSEDAYLRAAEEDTAFFLRIALQGDPEWYGDLMADHTARDWRMIIIEKFGLFSDSSVDLLVVASERSGCFPPTGPLWVVDAILQDEDGTNCGTLDSQGVVVDFGGHWCYWEYAEKFNDLALKYLTGPSYAQ